MFENWSTIETSFKERWLSTLSFHHCQAEYSSSGEMPGDISQAVLTTLWRAHRPPPDYLCCPKAHLSSLLLWSRLTYNNFKAWVGKPPACCLKKHVCIFHQTQVTQLSTAKGNQIKYNSDIQRSGRWVSCQPQCTANSCHILAPSQ